LAFLGKRAASEESIKTSKLRKMDKNNRFSPLADEEEEEEESVSPTHASSLRVALTTLFLDRDSKTNPSQMDKEVGNDKTRNIPERTKELDLSKALEEDHTTGENVHVQPQGQEESEVNTKQIDDKTNEWTSMKPMNNSHGYMNNTKQKSDSSHSGEQNIPTNNGGIHEGKEPKLHTINSRQANIIYSQGRSEHTAESSAHRSKVSFSTRAEIKLKDRPDRMLLHRYDLKIETKKMDSEAECENLIHKQLNLFFSIIL